MIESGLLSKLKVVIFDFDGTLVQSSIDFARMRQGIVDLLKDWQLYEQGMDKDRYVLEMIAFGREALQDVPERAAAFERQAMKIIEDIEMETCPHAAPFPGVLEALRVLSAKKLQVGIITRNGRRGVEAVISRHQLCHDVLLTRDDVEWVKPHPGHLQEALRRLNRFASEAVMVGDHPTDMACGKAARVFSIGVLTDRTTRAALLAAGADLVIPAVPDLLALLNGGDGNLVVQKS